MQYQSLTIENFRGIDRLAVTDLKRVNLLAGRNNCGKTSILEALFLLSGMSNPQLPVNIHGFRDLVLTRDEEFSVMFKDLDFAVPITIGGVLEDEQRTLTIRPLYASYKLRAANKQNLATVEAASASTVAVQIVEGLDLQFQGAGGQSRARISLKEKEVEVQGEYQEKLRCAFLNPVTMMAQIDRRMEELIVQKKLNNLIAILQEIDARVSDIRMGAGGKIYMDIGKEKLLPINVMGDGMRRILAIIAAIADLRNGVLLIDEIENGLHYTSLTVAWKALLASCQEYQVQLIATCHSYECIEACVQAHAGIDLHSDDIRLYRIEHNPQGHRAFAFNAEMLHAGVEKAFEVR